VIIACPACATRYVVPDSAIGVDGRTVRCAKCRHSWFQDGPVRAAAPPAPPPPPPPPPPPSTPPPAIEEPIAQIAPEWEPATEAAPVEPRVEPAVPAAPTAVWREEDRQRPEEPAPFAAAGRRDEPDEDRPATADPAEPIEAPPPAWTPPEPEPPTFAEPASNPVDVVFEHSPSSFEYEPPFRPRRNPAKLWTAAAVAFALLVAALIGAVSYWGLPHWVPIARPTFGAAQPDLVLEFPPERQDRRTLPDGTEYFGASGTVTNVGQDTRSVPAVLIVLRDGRDRKVYEWVVRPPKSELAPGESVTINEAVTDVPRSAKIAEIGWKP
jgi:predicted Zn finger-like uncharacterized protein